MGCTTKDNCEEDLKEACALGRKADVIEFLNSGIDVNHQNNVNGMTALHWAAVRGQKEIFDLLISRGADVLLRRSDGKTALDLVTSSSEKMMVPSVNYLTNQCFPYASNNNQLVPVQRNPVLKLRLAGADPDGDFFEITLQELLAAGSTVSGSQTVAASGDESSVAPTQPYAASLTTSQQRLPQFDVLLRGVCAELGVQSTQRVAKLRKLPDIVLRRDTDVARLKEGDALELRLRPKRECISSIQSLTSC